MLGRIAALGAAAQLAYGATVDTCSVCPDPTPVGTVCCVAGQRCPDASDCCSCGQKACQCPSSGPEPPPVPTPAGVPGKCMGECHSTLDCANNQYCKFCLNLTGEGKDRKGFCGAQCGETCEKDLDCSFKDGCMWCYGGVCSMTNPRATCGSPCVSDVTCREAHLNETSDCRLCYSSGSGDCGDKSGLPTGNCVCGGGCGRRCSSDAECVAKQCPSCADFGGSEGKRCNETKGR
eukprot:TRINITY_DN16696_c0_g1_i1.p1 TRINITY_DN16696_c0_g1~~TRINITY_DN16696_c0_g1_i1.p1  ORF type:complete len:264 (+),score=76.17 TRINITY_DN16696_c0_g1_i1:93-794(+)